MYNGIKIILKSLTMNRLNLLMYLNSGDGKITDKQIMDFSVGPLGILLSNYI